MIQHIIAGITRLPILALALGATGLIVAAQAARADDLDQLFSQHQWVESWAAAPQQPVDAVFGGTPRVFNDQTIRQVARLSVGGRTLRIRLTNEYGTAPVVIGAVHVAMANGRGGTVAGSDRVITFGGSGSVTIPVAAPALSDPIALPVSGLTSLAVSLYVPAGGNPGSATPHTLGQQTAYIVAGDQTGATTLTGALETTTSRFFLSGVDVLKGAIGATIVTFGDSITDGDASTVDANHRWPDYLALRLQSSVVLSGLAVANEGIAGNRVLSEGIGPNALSRFDRDVLSRPGVRYITLLEGINDIGFPNLPSSLPNLGTEPTAAQIITGYRQLIARAHERGVLIFGATLTPFQGAPYYTDVGEAIREAVNAFIRTSGEFDGVIDFDMAVRDPASPLRFLPAYDSGDHLHPNDVGYAKMADTVDLRLFLLPFYQQQ